MSEIIYLSKNANMKYNTRIGEQRTYVKQIFALINNFHCSGEKIQSIIYGNYSREKIHPTLILYYLVLRL